MRKLEAEYLLFERRAESGVQNAGLRTQSAQESRERERESSRPGESLAECGDREAGSTSAGMGLVSATPKWQLGNCIAEGLAEMRDRSEG